MAKEKRFENKVKAYLKSHDMWYIKYWAGSAFTKDGIPDILACINGQFYGIELKGEGGTPTLLQIVNLRKIRKSGGRAILLYPNDYDDFISYVEGNNPTWITKNIELQKQWFCKLGGKINNGKQKW